MSTHNEIEKHFRFEFKYILDPITYMKVRSFVDSISISHDENAKGNVYSVTSLYFDTFGLDDYYEKQGGILKRKKVRARIYGRDISDEVTEVHLEVKNKHDMYIGKKRTKVPVDVWESFIKGKSDEILDEFGLDIKAEGRVPVCVVRYEREALVETFYSRVRVTFDRNIEVIQHDDLELQEGKSYDIIPVSGLNTIMEIKFNKALPWWFGFMVREYDLRRDAYSKYSNSVDKLYKYNPLPR